MPRGRPVSDRRGWTSAWSAPAGWARCSVPRWPGPGTGWSPPARSAADSVERAEALLPGVPLREVPDVVRAADLVLLTVPDDELPALVRGPGRDRRLAGRADRRAHQRPVRRAGARARGRAARDRPGAAPGDDVQRAPPSTWSGWPAAASASPPTPAVRPMAEALVVEMGAEPVWVAEADRAALPRGPGARLEPPGHARRPGAAGAARAPGSTRPTGCSRRCCRRRWTARCAPATPRSPARSRAGTPVPSPRTWPSWPTETPDVRPTYVALARATAVRALASGRLSAPRRRGPARRPGQPEGDPVNAARRRAHPRGARRRRAPRWTTARSPS